jgi:hypothetical protein
MRLRHTILICAASALAADGLYGPVLGMMPELRNGALRPIRGIPGSATIGDPVALGDGNSVLAVSSRQNIGFVKGTDGTRIVSLSADGTALSTDSGLPAAFQPGAAVFSPAGTAAVLYDGAGAAFWWRQHTAVHLDISRLPDTPAKLAVSDGADPLIAGTLSGNARSLFVLGTGGYRIVPGFGEVSDVTFLGSGADIAVADSALKQVSIVRDGLSASAPELLLALADAPDAPISLASSADGALLAVLVAHRPLQAPAKRSSTRKFVLGVLHVADRQWTPVECDCIPDSLVPLRGNAVFRLTRRIDQPVWILDADLGTPRVLFVPAVTR